MAIFRKNSGVESKNTGLRNLFSGAKAPRHLQTKILKAMKNEGLVSTPKALITTSIPGVLTALLFAVFLLGTGFWFGHSRPASTRDNNGKPRFALLVKNDDLPPAEAGQQFREYSAWVSQLKNQREAGGEALHGKAWVINQPAGQTVQITEHELERSASELSGYFLFEAENAAEALKIAETCPHLKYSGTLELREIY